MTRIPYDELVIDQESGWKLVDLTTSQECDEALMCLSRDIVRIENQISEEETSDSDEPIDMDWLGSARAALAIKKTMKRLVDNRRIDIVRAEKRVAQQAYDHRLLAVLKREVPAAFAAAVEEIGGV